MLMRKEGFTLVELIITILIIGIIGLFVIPFFGDIFGNIFSAGDKTRATFEAQGLLVDSIQNKSEDGNTDNNILIDLVDENGVPIIEDISIEKRIETVSYQLPKNNNQNVNIEYYILIP